MRKRRWSGLVAVVLAIGLVPFLAGTASAATDTAWQPPAAIKAMTTTVVYEEVGWRGQTPTETRKLTQVDSHPEVRWEDDDTLNAIFDGDTDIQVLLTRPDHQRLTKGLMDHLPEWNSLVVGSIGGFQADGYTGRCTVTDQWASIDAVTYTGDSISALTMRWKVTCADNKPPRFGYLHWRADDPTTPPGPQPIPSTLWKPPAGSMPATGSAMYLTGKPGHKVAQGRTIDVDDSNALITFGEEPDPSARPHASFGAQPGGWSVVIFPMLDRPLEVGYYPNVMQGGANPVRGGFTVRADDGNCGVAPGWMAVDEVHRTNGVIDRLRMRFGNTCDGSGLMNVAIQVNLGGGPLPDVLLTDSSLREGSPGTHHENLSFELKRSATQDVTIPWRTNGGTATPGTDYIAASGTVTIPKGSIGAPFDLYTYGDIADEPDETIFITIGPVTGAKTPDTTMVITIEDDDDPDQPPPPTLSVADASFTEADTTADGAYSVLLSLDHASNRDATVDWAFEPGSATAGADYVDTTGTVQIVAGQTSAWINVGIVGDDAAEPTEQFTLSLSRPNGLLLPDGTATITVYDDDAATAVPTVRVEPATFVDGYGKHAEAFTISLSRPATTPVTVTWNTRAGTASSPSDYLGARATVTIPKGATSTTATLTIVGDQVVEPDEWFTLVLTNPTGAQLQGDGTTLAFLVNDD